MKAIPRSLFRFRPFNSFTLRELCNNGVHYADPTTFNDPLDSRPNLEVDSDFETLKALHGKIAQRLRKRFVASDWRYLATEDAEEGSDRWKRNACSILTGDIAEALRVNFGAYRLLSLTPKWNSPLMWSHYADAHRGICIEYDLENNDCRCLQPVRYDQPRSIKSSDLAKWLVARDTDAEKRVRDTYFFSKAKEWAYEKEWRDLIINERVSDGSPFRMKAVFFGLRCPDEVQTCIVRLLADHVHFYRIMNDETSFRLHRTRLDREAINDYSAQPSMRLTLRDDFGPFPNDLNLDQSTDPSVQ